MTVPNKTKNKKCIYSRCINRAYVVIAKVAKMAFWQAVIDKVFCSHSHANQDAQSKPTIEARWASD